MNSGDDGIELQSMAHPNNPGGVVGNYVSDDTPDEARANTGPFAGARGALMEQAVTAEQDERDQIARRGQGRRVRLVRDHNGGYAVMLGERIIQSFCGEFEDITRFQLPSGIEQQVRINIVEIGQARPLREEARVEGTYDEVPPRATGERWAAEELYRRRAAEHLQSLTLNALPNIRVGAPNRRAVEEAREARGPRPVRGVQMEEVVHLLDQLVETTIRQANMISDLAEHLRSRGG